MEQKALYFSENGITKNAFHKNKKPISSNEVDTKRIVLSDQKSYGNKDSFKHFIEYIHTGFFSTIIYRTSSNECKWMFW